MTMSEQNRKDDAFRIEQLLAAVDNLNRSTTRYPKPFDQVIRELETMSEFASKFPQIPTEPHGEVRGGSRPSATDMFPYKSAV